MGGNRAQTTNIQTQPGNRPANPPIIYGQGLNNMPVTYPSADAQNKIGKGQPPQ